MTKFFEVIFKFAFQILALNITIFNTTFSYLQLFTALFFIYIVFYIFFSVNN